MNPDFKQRRTVGGGKPRVPQLQSAEGPMRKMTWEVGTVPGGHWTIEINRVTAIRWLVKKTRKRPEEIIKEDFSINGLGGLLHNRYRNSPYLALTEASVLPEDFQPWQRETCVPRGYWDLKDNRIAAVKWLLERISKTDMPEAVTAKDFIENNLQGLLNKYDHSPFLALKEAGVLPEDFQPWYMKDGAPNRYWKSKKNQTEAVKWLLQKTNKEPEELLRDDFKENGLGGLLAVSNKSVYELLKESGVLPEGIKPWQMKSGIQNGYWNSKENRTCAVKWLLQKTGKNYADLTGDDFYAHGLYGLMAKFNGSPYGALREAEIFPKDFKPWQMTNGVPKGYWDSKTNVKAAVEWLMQQMNKTYREMIREDFISNGLGGLLTKHNGSPYDVLKVAGVLPDDFQPWQMRSGAPQGYWDSKVNRAYAVKWLLKKTGKRPEEIKVQDFKKNGLLGLLLKNKGSPYLALRDAGITVKPFEMTKTNYALFSDQDWLALIKDVADKYRSGQLSHLFAEDFYEHGSGAALKFWQNKHKLEDRRQALEHLMKTYYPHTVLSFVRPTNESFNQTFLDAMQKFIKETKS